MCERERVWLCVFVCVYEGALFSPFKFLCGFCLRSCCKQRLCVCVCVCVDVCGCVCGLVDVEVRICIPLIIDMFNNQVGGLLLLLGALFFFVSVGVRMCV